MRAGGTTRIGGLALGAAVAVALTAAPAAARTYEVNRLADPDPGACTPKHCTLREAVLAANERPGADRIVLRGGSTYRLEISGSGEDAAATGDLDLTDRVTIAAVGPKPRRRRNARIAAAGLDRHFDLHAPAKLVRLTLSGGSSPASGPQDDRDGGAVRAGASLTLQRAVVAGNTAGGNGGGVALIDGTRHLIELSRIAGNKTIDGNGGGIANLGSAPAKVAGTTVSSNRTASGSFDGDGGGIYHVLDNGADTGSMTVINTTIDRNYSSDDGGGVDSHATLLMVNSTLARNTADDYAGGLRHNDNDGQGVTLNNVTVARNVVIGNGEAGGLGGSGPWRVSNTIIGLNDIESGTIGPDCDIEPAALVAASRNLVTDATDCAAASPNSIVSPTPRLGQLRRNGGPTATIALLAGSPALNAGLACAKRDQRGVRRTLPRARPCDIGAYERLRATKKKKKK